MSQKPLPTDSCNSPSPSRANRPLDQMPLPKAKEVTPEDRWFFLRCYRKPKAPSVDDWGPVRSDFEMDAK
jgi:hypothetical protein